MRAQSLSLPAERRRAGIALFDVDGVLVKGFIMLSLGRYLFRSGLVPRWLWLPVASDFTSYRLGLTPYARFAARYKEHFGLAIAGLDRSHLLDASDRVCREELEFYWYARDLVSLFRGRDILTVAVSGAPDECGAPLRSLLGLDGFYGTVFEVDAKSVYTGKTVRNMAIRASKEMVVRALGEQVDFSVSFGFGDTSQDLPILESVTQPVVINAKSELRQVAARRGWRMLSYRMDVVKEARKLLEALPV